MVVLTHCSRNRRGGEAGVLISNRPSEEAVTQLGFARKEGVPWADAKGSGNGFWQWEQY